jgi:hypothetical protein
VTEVDLLKWGEQPPTVFPGIWSSKAVARQEADARRERRQDAGLVVGDGRCYEPKATGKVGEIPEPPSIGYRASGHLLAALRASDDVVERVSGYGVRGDPEQLGRWQSEYCQRMKEVADPASTEKLPSFDDWLRQQGFFAAEIPDDVAPVPIPPGVVLRQLSIRLNRLEVEQGPPAEEGTFKPRYLNPFSF